MIDAYSVGTTMSLDVKGMANSLRAIAAQYQRLQELGSQLSDNSKATARAISDIARASRPAAAVVRQMAEAMKALNEQAKAARSNTSSLGMQEQKLSDARARESERQTDRQARLARQQQSDTDRSTRQMEAAAHSAGRAQAQAAAYTRNAWGSAYNAISLRAARVSGSLGSPLSGGLAGLTAFAGGHIVRSAINESTEYDRLGMNMQLYRNRTEDRTNMEKASVDVSARHGDLSQLDAMKMFNETIGIVGPEHSVAMGDMMANARTRLTQIYHGNMPENSMQQLLKFAEESGRIYNKDDEVDPERVNAAFNIAIEAARRSGGMAQLPALVDAMRSSRGIARTMSDDALMQFLEGQVVTQKGTGTGTGIESMASGLLRGKINEDQFHMLNTTGNLDINKVRHIRGTNQYNLENGAFTSIEEMMSNPFQWALDQINKYSKAHNISQEQAIYKMFPRQRSRGFATQLLNGLAMSITNKKAEREGLLGPNNEGAKRDASGEVMRDASGNIIIDHTKSSAYQASQINSQTQGNQIDQVAKAFDNLSLVMGKAVFQSGKGILGEIIANLDSMSVWASKNGVTLREAISSLAGVAGIGALAGSIVMLHTAFVPLILGGAILKGLEAFTGKQGLPAVTAALEGLFKVLEYIPDWVKGLVTGTVVGARAGPLGALAGGVAGIGLSQLGNAAGNTDEQRNRTEVWAGAYKDQLIRQGIAPGLAEFFSTHGNFRFFEGAPEQEGLRDKAGKLIPLDQLPMYPEGYGKDGKLPTVPPTVTEQGRTLGFPGGTPGDNGGAVVPQQHSYVPGSEGGVRIQQPIILSMDSKEMGRAMITVLGREASRPSTGYSGFDGRQSPMQPGAMPALG